jgi:hypothetical protein
MVYLLRFDPIWAIDENATTVKENPHPAESSS